MGKNQKKPKLAEIAPHEIRTVCHGCGRVVGQRFLWCNECDPHSNKSRRSDKEELPPPATTKLSMKPEAIAARRQEIERLWKEGWTGQQIAKHLGMHPTSIYSMRKNGTNLPHRTPAIIEHGRRLGNERKGR